MRYKRSPVPAQHRRPGHRRAPRKDRARQIPPARTVRTTRDPREQLPDRPALTSTRTQPEHRPVRPPLVDGLHTCPLSAGIPAAPRGPEIIGTSWPPWVSASSVAARRTWDMAASIHRADCSGCPAQSAGNPTYPPIGRSGGPLPSTAANSRRPASSTSRTPIVEPNAPANMLPFTNAPRLPNIGFTTTAGSPGISARNLSLSCSVGFGTCIQPTVLNEPAHPVMDVPPTSPSRRSPRHLQTQVDPPKLGCPTPRRPPSPTRGARSADLPRRSPLAEPLDMGPVGGRWKSTTTWLFPNQLPGRLVSDLPLPTEVCHAYSFRSLAGGHAVLG